MSNNIITPPRRVFMGADWADGEDIPIPTEDVERSAADTMEEDLESEATRDFDASFVNLINRVVAQYQQSTTNEIVAETDNMMRSLANESLADRVITFPEGSVVSHGGNPLGIVTDTSSDGIMTVDITPQLQQSSRSYISDQLREISFTERIFSSTNIPQLSEKEQRRNRVLEQVEQLKRELLQRIDNDEILDVNVQVVMPMDADQIQLSLMVDEAKNDKEARKLTL